MQAMRGWSAPFGRVPKPAEFVLRLAAASILVLWAFQLWGASIVEATAPAVRAAWQLVDSDFAIIDLTVAPEGRQDVLRVRADFAHPVYVNGYRLEPLGARPGDGGWHQSQVTIGGVLQGATAALIALLMWPARSVRSFLTRLAIGLPALLVLTAFDAATALLANLWMLFTEEWDPNGLWPSIVLVKLLDGGGRFAAALVIAVLIIALADRLGRKPQPHAENGGLILRAVRGE